MAPFGGRLPFDRAVDKLKDVVLNLKSKGLYAKWKLRSEDGIRDSKQWVYTYKLRIAGSIGAAVLLVGTVYVGHQYVQANMNDVYEVYVEGELVGEVSSPEVVEEVIVHKLNEVSQSNPNVQWEIEREGIRIEKDVVFKGEGDDEETSAALASLVEAKAVGVELVVNGKAMAVVKDEETASRILDRVKNAYVSSDAPAGLVSVLSTDNGSKRSEDVLAEGTPEVQSVRILEPVNLGKREIQPNDVMTEEEVLSLLMVGDVKPTRYVVQEGDTPSGIAQKLNVPLELLYAKNQDHKGLIERDFIKVGDVLDLTMPQPAVTIESVEKLTDTIAIKHETIYEEDPTMRKGQTETIRPGKNGVKKVTYLLTKVNGLLMEEHVSDEVIVEEPVSAVVKRGTKVILGEGTGKLSWPVVSARITSGFGKRWGRQHKGIDMVGNKSILAADTGTVVFAGRKDAYGNAIIIDHKNGMETLYGHLSKISVKKGDIVEKGDKIGVMGSTGRSTGVHLHFEVIENGAEKNPMSYLRR